MRRARKGICELTFEGAEPVEGVRFGITKDGKLVDRDESVFGFSRKEVIRPMDDTSAQLTFIQLAAKPLWHAPTLPGQAAFHQRFNLVVIASMEEISHAADARLQGYPGAQFRYIPANAAHLRTERIDQQRHFHGSGL
jgi:hypothetical protein